MKKLFRVCFIAWTALRYGLDEMALSCLPRPWLRALGRLTRRGRRLTAPRGQRLRMALERLGPIFVKFGQVLSTREAWHTPVSVAFCSPLGWVCSP